MISAMSGGWKECNSFTHPAHIHPSSLRIWTCNLWVSTQLLSPLGSRQSSTACFLFMVFHSSMRHSRCSQWRSFLGRTRLPRSKRLQQPFGPIASIEKHFCFNFPSWWTKDKKQAGHNSKLSPSNIFHRASMVFISVVFTLVVIWTSFTQYLLQWTRFMCTFILFRHITMCLWPSNEGEQNLIERFSLLYSLKSLSTQFKFQTGLN